jgi:two-component system chemotaxis response regulator CheY
MCNSVVKNNKKNNMTQTILVVDDSSSLRQVVRLTLEVSGYKMLEATNGKEALAILEKTAQINLIVSDLNMPIMNGLEFAAKVKEMPIHKFTPILMLTTEVSDEKKEIAKASGVKAWMTKPFTPATFMKAVEKLSK